MAGLDVDQLKNRVSSFLSGFSVSQLVIIGLLTVVAGVGSVSFLTWVTAPTYGVLLAGLDPKDASAVTAKLDADGVAYQLAAGGATVMVPTDLLDAQRIALAAEGLPAGKTDSGWAVLDGQGLTSSSFQQQIAYQRALEGTLSTSVGQIEGVRAAEVHLALPEKRLFTDSQQPARASVLVTTDGSLDDRAVEAVTRLVASAVPNLQASDVTVTDSSGRLLSSDGASAGTDRADRARTELETTLEGRVSTLFDQLLGPGRAVVRVNAELDLANRTIDSETFDNQKTSVLSSTTSEETYATAPGQNAAGVVGLVPGQQPPPGTATSPGYTKKQVAQQNGVSRTVEKQVLAPGAVKRLTVAVAVDRNARNAPSPAELQLLVGNSVGLDPARGDTISVTTPSFLEVEPAEKKDDAPTASSLTDLAPQVLGGVLLLLVAVGLMRTARRSVAIDVTDAEVTAALDRTGGRAALPPSSQAALPAGGAAPRSDEDEADVMHLLEDDAEVAGMLRGWLTNVGGPQ